MATKVVGLDLGSHTVKVCELVTTFRNFELVGFGSEPVEALPAFAGPLTTGSGAFRLDAVEEEDSGPEMAVAMAAHRLLERRGLLGETLMCALPPDIGSTAVLEFPFSQPRKIEQVLAFQLDEAVPFDVEDCVFDYQIVRRQEDGSCEVLVAYVKRDAFERFLEALSRVGIDPKVVGFGALSYFNLYDHIIPEGAQAPVAVLDVGHAHSELCIFDSGDPTVVRDLPFGGEAVTRALADIFSVEPVQAERGKVSEGFVAPRSGDTQVDATIDGTSRKELVGNTCRGAVEPVVREVKRSLVAHELKTGNTVERIYLTGGGSLLRGLGAYIEHVTGVEVVPLQPLNPAFSRLADGGEGVRPYIAKPLALCLRAFHREHQSLVNFRKGEYAYTGDFGFLRGRIISMAVAAVVMVVLAAFGVMTKKQALQAEYQTLLNQVRATAVQVMGEETDDVNLVLASMAAPSASPAAAIPEHSAYDILAELSQAITPEIKIDVDQLEVDLERSKLEINGKTDSGGSVERIVEAVQTTKCFKRVSKERVEKAVDDRTKFRLSAASVCGQEGNRG